VTLGAYDFWRMVILEHLTLGILSSWPERGLCGSMNENSRDFALLKN
jgi:hypothetical protein